MRGSPGARSPKRTRASASGPDDELCRLPYHGPETGELRLRYRALAPGEIDEQDRQRAFVHLDAVPESGAVEPAILRPVAGGFLDRPQIVKDLARFALRSGGNHAARGLDEVARPDEMVAAQVLVAFGEAPGDRQAGDVAAGERPRLVRAQHRGADTVGIRPAAARSSIQRKKRALPGTPAGDVSGKGGFDSVVEARAHAKRGFRGAAPESERQA